MTGRPAGVTIAVLAAAIAVMPAAPAAAWEPDGTMTLVAASADATVEDAVWTFSGECPAGAAEATIILIWNGSTSQLQVPLHFDPATGEFSGDADLTAELGRGTAYSANGVCSDAAGQSLAQTAVNPLTVPDVGQTLTGPAVVPVDREIEVAVRCGTSPANEVVFDLVAVNGAVGIPVGNVGPLPFTAAGDDAQSYRLDTPAVRGLEAGDEVVVVASCRAGGSTVSRRSVQIGIGSAAAPSPGGATPIPPATDEPGPETPSRTDRALADTGGTGPETFVAVASLALLAGAVLSARATRPRGRRLPRRR